jgi:hypothetical protein
MTKYVKSFAFQALDLANKNIAYSCSVSKKTVNKVLKKAQELEISWPLAENQTDAVLANLFFSSADSQSDDRKKRMPDFHHIRKELLRNGVSKKLLWTEYMEECRLNGEEPLMYSQFCYYIQQD